MGLSTVDTTAQAHTHGHDAWIRAGGSAATQHTQRSHGTVRGTTTAAQGGTRSTKANALLTGVGKREVDGVARERPRVQTSSRAGACARRILGKIVDIV